MMTSTYPGSRSNNNLTNGLREIQCKKDALLSLETALKRRVNELKELCLKEGELTGQLPVDYPLQPREPIPQIRRRVHHSSGSSNNSNSNSISNSNSNSNLDDIDFNAPTSTRSHQTKLDSVKPHVTFAIPSNVLASTNHTFPSRPTSTNSTSSSVSTASSNTRSARNAISNSQLMTSNPVNKNLLANSAQLINNNNNRHCYNPEQINHTSQALNQFNSRDHNRYNHSFMPNNFKRPFHTGSATTFDADALGHMRASSTASSSSSSGSGTSSVLSAPPAVSMMQNSIGLGINMHGRSCSESLTNDCNPLGSKSHSYQRSQNMLHNQQVSDNRTNFHANLIVQPERPPRGLHHSNRQISVDALDSNVPKRPFENKTSLANTHQLQKDIISGKTSHQYKMPDSDNFQPFLEEETKPFQMSDFYKYSSKYRQKSSDPQKTTRQLQEDVAKKNSLKYSSCDEQFQGLPKLFEKSSQKLIEATAKAIAGNPGLAEKLNNILPSNKNDRFASSI